MKLKIQYYNFFNVNFLLLSLICVLRFKFFAASHLFGFLFFGFCFFTYCLINFRYKFFINFIYSFFLFLSFGALSFFLSGNPSDNGIIYHLLMYSVPVIYVIIATSYLLNLSKDEILFDLEKIGKIIIIYLIIENVVRFLTIFIHLRRGEVIKVYVLLKTMSFTYSDLNYLGLFTLNMFCLYLYLYQKTKIIIFRKYYLIFFIFGITSISRSVMITELSIFYLMFLYKQFKKGKLLLFVSNILIIPFGILLLYNLLQVDASFRSKLVIFQGMSRLFTKNISNQLWGFGYGKGEFMYSYREGDYGHIHLALFLGQIGIMGVLLTVYWFLKINFLSKNKTLIILYSFLLSGLSLAFYDSSLFYVMSIIYVMEYKLKNNNYIEENGNE